MNADQNNGNYLPKRMATTQDKVKITSSKTHVPHPSRLLILSAFIGG